MLLALNMQGFDFVLKTTSEGETNSTPKVEKSCKHKKRNLLILQPLEQQPDIYLQHQNHPLQPPTKPLQQATEQLQYHTQQLQRILRPQPQTMR